tara:strand:- start:188 stop:544 length:357 start_codon:yes stop_codon:yes gene_type:complete
MKKKYKINSSQKSILGFKILTSRQSSIASYALIFCGLILNPFFGLNKIQIIAGSLFNFLLNTSVLILIINLLIKREEIKKINFISLNFGLFIYLPIAISSLFINGIKILNFLKQQISL